MQQLARDPFREDVWDELAARLHYVATDFADEAARTRSHDAARASSTRSSGTGGNRVYYLAVPPPAFPTDRRGARQAARRPRAGRGSIVEKPFGHDLESAKQLTTSCCEHFAEERDLPDRPLPRQGDGPEHARAALRERDLRADLEPPVHRPRPDHRRRVDRDRGPRRLLRARRRDPRHLPEPPAPAARDHGDGAADRLHRRLGPQREGQGAARAAHAGAEVGRARAVRARLRRGRGGRRRTARRRASRRTR